MANLASGLQWAETAVWQFLTNFETQIMRADKWQRVDGLCNFLQCFVTLMAFLEILFFFFEVVVSTLFQDDFQRNHCSWVNSGWSVSFCMMVMYSADIFCYIISPQWTTTLTNRGGFEVSFFMTMGSLVSLVSTGFKSRLLICPKAQMCFKEGLICDIRRPSKGSFQKLPSGFFPLRGFPPPPQWARRPDNEKCKIKNKALKTSGR